MNDHVDRLWCVKVYQGSPDKGMQHFQVGTQIRILMSDFSTLDSKIYTIRENLLRTPDLYYLRDILREKAKMFNVTKECLLADIRVSGPSWKFPYHCDQIDQLVFHISGCKTWYWKDTFGNEQKIVASETDVVFVPAGVYHRTENQMTTMVCNYGVEADAQLCFCERGPSGGDLSPRNVCHNG
jgi:mannose-6-phosphate isomerase-like protein (cupin superfamily)